MPEKSIVSLISGIHGIVMLNVKRSFLSNKYVLFLPKRFSNIALDLCTLCTKYPDKTDDSCGFCVAI